LDATQVVAKLGAADLDDKRGRVTLGVAVGLVLRAAGRGRQDPRVVRCAASRRCHGGWSSQVVGLVVGPVFEAAAMQWGSKPPQQAWLASRERSASPPRRSPPAWTMSRRQRSAPT